MSVFGFCFLCRFSPFLLDQPGFTLHHSHGQATRGDTAATSLNKNPCSSTRLLRDIYNMAAAAASRRQGLQAQSD